MSELYTPVYLESGADLAERPSSHSRPLAMADKDLERAASRTGGPKERPRGRVGR